MESDLGDVLIEKDTEFTCPYCNVAQWIRVDPSEGTRQQMVSDCEICCQPIVVRVVFDGEALESFFVERENG